MEIRIIPTDLRLQAVDPEIALAIERERHRQQENIELIASENFTSPAVMEAQGSVLTNKYAEGYPKKRWYGGCENVDTVEQLAIDRAKQALRRRARQRAAALRQRREHGGLFRLPQAGRQDADDGPDATAAISRTATRRISPASSSRSSTTASARRTSASITISWRTLAREHKPKMITVGASAYPRIIDFARMGEIAREVGAYLLADIAHIAGLVAAGLHPSPIAHADFVTTTDCDCQ